MVFHQLVSVSGPSTALRKVFWSKQNFFLVIILFWAEFIYKFLTKVESPEVDWQHRAAVLFTYILFPSIDLQFSNLPTALQLLDLSRKSSLVNVRLTPSICPGVLLFTTPGVALLLEMPVHLSNVNFVSVPYDME